MSPFKIGILYATQTGVSKTLAERIGLLLHSKQFIIEISCFNEISDVAALRTFRCLIFICSSTGQGDPPDNAARFYRQLRILSRGNSNVLSECRYTLLGLGDSNYQTFGAFPKSLQRILQKLGASTFYDFKLADDAVGLETVVEPFIENLSESIYKELDFEKEFKEMASPTNVCKSDVLQTSYTIINMEKVQIPEKGLKLPTIPPSYLELSFGDDVSAVEIDEYSKSFYKTQKPFGANSDVTCLPLVSSDKLTGKSALKPVYELILDATILPTVSSMLPGDSFSMLCCNDSNEVNCIIKRLNLTEVADLQIRLSSPKLQAHLKADNAAFTFRRALTFCCDLRSPPKKAFLRLMANSCSNEGEKRELEYLSSFEGSSTFASTLREAQLSILDLLLLFSSVNITAGQLLENLAPLKPRSYSLANSPEIVGQLKFAISEVYLSKGDNRQYDRHGVCTKFMLDAINSLKNGKTPYLPIFTRTIQPFRLPEDKTLPLLLVSAGTGLAPYISFFEYLDNLKATGTEVPKDIWLFHGFRYRDKDFIYREKIEGFVKNGLITKLSLACSRQDPPQPDGSRTYVQHRILECAEDFINLVPPPVIYVCGDGARMAPSLRETLVKIICKRENISEKESLVVFKQWIKSGRYKEDVWR